MTLSRLERDREYLKHYNVSNVALKILDSNGYVGDDIVMYILLKNNGTMDLEKLVEEYGAFIKEYGYEAPEEVIRATVEGSLKFLTEISKKVEIANNVVKLSRKFYTQIKGYDLGMIADYMLPLIEHSLAKGGDNNG